LLSTQSGLLQQEFKGHDLAVLVEELLSADGFICKRSPEGSDGGVDVIAGMGPLGMDSPKLVVQVKSQTSPVSDQVLQQLNGAIQRFQANQALLVSYGGVTGPAKKFLASQPFLVRVWETQDIIDAVIKNYDKLSGDTRARLPLKQIWVPVSEEASD
jgi:restriction system protein